MSFLKSLFTNTEESIESYTDFWSWFEKHERNFFNAVKSGKNINKVFFDKLSPTLLKLKEGYFFLTGMFDDNTVELIFTADGNPKNIVFVEELVKSAPQIKGWLFTSLKPALNIEDVNIEMEGYKFNDEKISFYSNELSQYPDEIDITIIHNDLTEENRSQITNGIYIFLDNYLGELDFLTKIDNLTIDGVKNIQKELVPISKLKDFLSWRQKEFIEKYKMLRHDTENDNYSMLEAELESGNTLFAVVNTDLLRWEGKASHPWICILTIKYNGDDTGMPKEKDYQMLDIIEEELMKELKDFDGFLNIGRQTAKGERDIYFACKDFRKPSKVFYQIMGTYCEHFEIEYDIYKDKYWQSFERFRPN